MAKRNTDTSARADQLKEDLRHLSETVEELVNATSKDASSEMRDLRERAERRLKDTRTRLEARGERFYEDTRETLSEQAACCDRYVHENPQPLDQHRYWRRCWPCRWYAARASLMALGPTQRVFSAAKRLLKSLVANSETRLRLAVLELEEERARLLVL